MEMKPKEVRPHLNGVVEMVRLPLSHSHVPIPIIFTWSWNHFPTFFPVQIRQKLILRSCLCLVHLHTSLPVWGPPHYS